MLWAPCAGPILGLILTGAALHGASTRTSLLLAAHAAGAGTSLALALLVGGRIFALMKHSLGVGVWVRRGLGGVVLAAVLVIASGLDTSVLTRVSLASTTALEQGLLDRFRAGTGASRHPIEVAAGNQAMKTGNPTIMMTTAADLPIEGDLPSLSGAVQWLNSPPLTDAALKGKVVLIDFWTYSCINCLRELPYVRAWAEKYREHGLVVIGVHAPEFAFERNVDNVKKAVAQLKLDFPIAIDNDYAIWRDFDNEDWPAEYFVDGRGHARDLHLVLGPTPDGKPIRFQVTIDGASPGDSHGVDVDAQGQGVVTGQRLYQLVRQGGNVADHTFEIRFLDPGVQAYSFTFG